MDDSGKLNEINDEVNQKLNQSHLIDVSKVTPTVVKEAASHIKDDKTVSRMGQISYLKHFLWS